MKMTWSEPYMGLSQLRGDSDLPYAAISVYDTFTEARIVIADKKLVVKIANLVRVLAMDENDYAGGDYPGENIFIPSGADHGAAARKWCEDNLKPYLKS